MSFILIYITNPSLKEAKKIAHHLIGKELIACANIHGIDSIYPWKGKIVDQKEYVLIAKTTNKNFNKIKSEVEKIHAYSIPCIIKIPVNSNKKYEKWLKDVIQ